MDNFTNLPLTFYCGSIYSLGCIVEEPTVMFDNATGTLLKWGDKERVKQKFDSCVASLPPEISKDYILLAFDTMMYSKEQLFYLLDRILHCQGFIGKFYAENVMKGTPFEFPENLSEFIKGEIPY